MMNILYKSKGLYSFRRNNAVISRNSDSNVKTRSFYSSGAVTAGDIETRIGKKPDSHHCNVASNDVFGGRD